MKLFNVSRWVGCFFAHSGKWGPAKPEAWVSYSDGTKREFYKTVQFRTCTTCNAVEKREVCSGR